MNVKFENKEAKIRFRDLKSGDAFMYVTYSTPETDVFIRANEGDKYINIQTGIILEDLDDDEMIVKIDAEVIVR